MIYIGTDIVEVNRIKDIIINNGDNFKNRIFDKNEVDYCLSQKNPYIHYAGRFSAKEAIKKALLSSTIIDKIALKKIVIVRSKIGVPEVLLPPEISILGIIKVSISHTENLASATAIFMLKK